PDAISVAAVTNSHVFAPVLTVAVPDGLPTVPVTLGTGGIPNSCSGADQKLVDVGTIVGTDGKPVERHLCGPPNDLEAPRSPLPKGSLTGAIALVSRGDCTFASKAARAQDAGAVGIIFVDNRPGEANGVSVRLPLPDAMISDLDGANLRAAMAATGGRATIRVGTAVQQVETGRSGIPVSFSAGGPTAFGHDLKPDISAPGGAILSSTVTETIGEPFAVLAGTSMSAPHITGAAGRRGLPARFSTSARGRSTRRRLRLHRAPARGRHAPHPLLLLRHAAEARGRPGPAAAAPPDGDHRAGRRPDRPLPVPERSVRPA